jgi:hypothetical protein
MEHLTWFLNDLDPTISFHVINNVIKLKSKSYQIPNDKDDVLFFKFLFVSVELLG